MTYNCGMIYKIDKSSRSFPHKFKFLILLFINLAGIQTPPPPTPKKEDEIDQKTCFSLRHYFKSQPYDRDDDLMI